MESIPSKICKKQRKSSIKYRSFEQARKFARKQQISSAPKWHMFVRTDKCPENIPSYPDRVYGPTLWKGWRDFLGYIAPPPAEPLPKPPKVVKPSKPPKVRKVRKVRKPSPGRTVRIVSFEEAKVVVQAHKFQSKDQYYQWFHSFDPRPCTMSIQPQVHYTKDWVSWEDFLGCEPWPKVRHPNHVPPPGRTNRPLSYQTMMEAIKLASRLGLRDRGEWLKWRGQYQYDDLPWRPEDYYKEEWCGWPIFLGHDAIPGQLLNVSVLFVGKAAGDPGNVYRVEIHPMGRSDLLHRAEREGFRVLRMWKYEPELRLQVRAAIAVNCSGWYGSDKLFLISNIVGFNADIFNLLAVVT